MRLGTQCELVATKIRSYCEPVGHSFEGVDIRINTAKDGSYLAVEGLLSSLIKAMPSKVSELKMRPEESYRVIACC